MKLHTYEYTCQNKECNHTWTDAREEAYASMPTKFPCPGCLGREITFEKLEPEVKTIDSKTTGPAFIDPTRLGRIKKPQGFKDVLGKVAAKYPGHNINMD